jgi:hypothetical protein
MSAAVEIYTNDSENTLSVPLIAVTARENGEDTTEDGKKKGCKGMALKFPLYTRKQ